MIASKIPIHLLPLEAEYVTDDGNVYTVTIERTHPDIDAALVVLPDNSRKLVPCAYLRSQGDREKLTGFVPYHYRHEKGGPRKTQARLRVCAKCGETLNAQTATPSQIQNGGYCRACTSNRNRKRERRTA